MAKGKQSPALFEVVHGKRHFDKSATVLRTPNWWFKGRHRGPSLPVVVSGDPPAFADEPDPTLAGLPSPLQPDPRPPASTAAPVEYESPPSNDAATFPMPNLRGRSSPFQFVIDRDRQELFFRVRYTAAIIASFALVVVIGMAYMGGRHFGRGPSAALASQSSDEIARGPVETGVLDVGTRSGARVVGAAPSPGMGVGGVSAKPAPARGNEGTVAPPAGATSGRSPISSMPPKSAGFENGRRVVGLQYFVIQGYASEQRKLAEEARDFLTKAGVQCTIENGVAGWPSSWHTVIGTQGFDRASGPQYDAYREKIIRIGENFAGRSAWKKFEPSPIRWKE